MSVAQKVVENLLSKDALRTEADIQSDIKALLVSEAMNLQSDQVVRLEEQTNDGTRRRLDIAVGHAVIEVKKSLTNPALVADAIDQLGGYMRTRISIFRRRYVGILTDGCEWILFDLIDGAMCEISRMTLTATTPDRLFGWLEAILATETGVKPVPSEIQSRLGANSPAYLLDYKELSALYEAGKTNPEVALKRELWAKLLRTAFGSAFRDDAETFINHTLLVVTAEIIAHAVMGLDVGATGGIDPASLVTGREFDNAHLYGVVEADFFDWVVEIEGGESFVTALAHRISKFDWSAVEHDVLKHLYESIISQEDRADLGEYYTPDWLADRIVDATITDPLNQRALDPSCGSGTFLFHAIRKYLQAADDDGVANMQALEGLTTHVIGIDIHPVATTLARVTYLLAIGTQRLTGQDRSSLTVPVYLGDSLQWEQRQDLFHTDDVVSISTTGSELVEGGASLGDTDLVFPRSVLKDAARFDRLVSDMATKALDLSGKESKTIVREIQKTHSLDDEETEIIGPTFATMRALHRAQRNHIWGFYVRNLIRPIWLSQPENRVDVMVGNPPWLRYSKMTAGMQSRYKALAKPRNLLTGGLGASARDLSTLFVVRAVEMYLKPGGAFSFVMPHGVLTRRPHTGFRAGVWSPKDTGAGRLVVAFDVPWDLVGAPTGFPMVSCVVRGNHLASTTANAVPIPAAVVKWVAKFSNPNQSWPAVKDRFTVSDSAVGVIDSDVNYAESPYKAMFRQGAIIVPRVLFMVNELSAGPLGVGAGRVRVESRRTSAEKKPWKFLNPSSRVVEREVVRDIYFGENITPYRALDPFAAVVPINGNSILGRAEIANHADLNSWWDMAEGLWDTNKQSSDQSTLLERMNFHNQLSAQLPVAPHRVVYTKTGTTLVAARLPECDAIIDHSLYWASTKSGSESLFLVGILNSKVLLDRVKPLQALGLFGARHFDKAVFLVPFGRFDEHDSDHLELVHLVEEAEQLVLSLALPARFQNARKVVRDGIAKAGLEAKIESVVGRVLPVVA